MTCDVFPGSRRLEAARCGHQHLLRDDQARQRARRHQPVPGVPGLRLRPGAGGRGDRGHARRPQPVRADAGRAGAARGHRRQGRAAATARTYDPATEVVVTSGATAGLYATLTALVQPGDEVVLFEPCYDSYVPVIRLSGGTPVFVSLRYPDYAVNWDDVRRAITPRTRADPGQHPAQPHRDDVDRRRHAPARRASSTAPASSSSRDEVYEHIIFDGRRHESVLRYPELRIARRGHQLVRQDLSHHGLEGGLLRGAAGADRPRCTRVHQFVTFTVHTPSQIAFAEFVARDPAATRAAGVLPGEARPVSRAHRGFPVHAPAVRGHLLPVARLLRDLEGRATSDDRAALMRQHGVAAIPVSAFLYRTPAARCCVSASRRRRRRWQPRRRG